MAKMFLAAANGLLAASFSSVMSVAALSARSESSTDAVMASIFTLVRVGSVESSKPSGGASCSFCNSESKALGCLETSGSAGFGIVGAAATAVAAVRAAGFGAVRSTTGLGGGAGAPDGGALRV
jgi:putative hemolysin